MIALQSLIIIIKKGRSKYIQSAAQLFPPNKRKNLYFLLISTESYFRSRIPKITK